MFTLYLCATPIGNLGDITLRVLDTLKEVSLIACEDTRHSAKLLNHYNISKSLWAYHDHNKEQVTKKIIAHLKEVGDVALLTDAGMPCISDPGFELVCACQAENLNYVVLPGASATLTALVASGLASDRFVFEGFLPRTGKKRGERLKQLSTEERTIILYESPKRVLATLTDLAAYCGDRPLSICRELTKQYEEVRTGTALSHLEHFKVHEPRGEFVLVISGARPTIATLECGIAHAQQAMRTGESLKDAAKNASLAYPHLAKRDIYKALLEQKEKS